MRILYYGRSVLEEKEEVYPVAEKYSCTNHTDQHVGRARRDP